MLLCKFSVTWVHYLVVNWTGYLEKISQQCYLNWTAIFQPDFDVNYQIANATKSSVLFRNVASAFIDI